ncbi:MAG TPA: hypothetical protein DCS67_05435 [Clostridiales bacterium UBA8960]|nr:hypothetical protein [Clostridiales bacterium UBA8960]
MRKITVEPYNPEWKNEFNKAQAFYSTSLVGLDVQIEHVGSTSVEGLWAKPILDIDIIVNDAETIRKVIDRLEECGYKHVGNYGVEGREALKLDQTNTKIDWMAHNLYVCLADNENVINHLMLRAHLRRNKNAVKAYSEIKRNLAELYPDDMTSYLDGKTDLIIGFLREEGMSEEAIQRIMDINKK